MTMVASLLVHKWPILIGDLLISSTIKPDKIVCLPTVHDEIPKLHSSNKYVTGLKQKTIIINDELAICWANSPFYASILIRDLISEFKYKHCSIGEMLRYLDNIDLEIRDNVSIVGMLRYNKLFHTFGFNCRNMSLNDIGDIIYLEGSGTEDFLEALNAFTESNLYKLNPLQYAVSTLIRTYNYMLCKEISSEESFIKCYGGGYELVSYVNGRFQKINDITHILWIATEDDNGKWTLSLPRLIMKYEYYHDLLLIRRGEFVNKPDGSGFVKMALKNEVPYEVRPIYESSDKTELENQHKVDLPNFNSNFICNNILMLKRTGKANCSQFFNYSGNGTNPIRFSEINSEIQIQIDETFIRSIYEDISK